MRRESLRQDFQAEANARLERFRNGAPSLLWNAMKDYLRKRAQGIEVDKPTARTLIR